MKIILRMCGMHAIGFSLLYLPVMYLEIGPAIVCLVGLVLLRDSRVASSLC